MSVLDVLLEGFDDAKHPRGSLGRWVATFHHSVHGRTTSPIEARSAEEAWSKAEEHARASSGRTAQMTVQSVEPLPVASSRVRGATQVDAQIAAGRRTSRPRVRGDGRSGPITPSSRAFDPVTSLGREGQAARGRGASATTTEHADTRDKLANLPHGQRYGLHGPQGQVGHVERTAEGWHVVGSSGAPTTHKTPSSAAGAAMRIQRKAASSRENADVMARNYRGGREVERMNARQRQRAAAERLRSVREAQPMVLGALLERDFSAERRQKLASSGAAMKDGSFPIENASDLSNAVQAVGRASNPDAAKSHIRKRAKALGLTSQLPDGW